MHGHMADHGYALIVPLDSLHLLYYGHCTQVLERSDPMAAVLDMPRCKAVRGPNPLTQHSMPQTRTPTPNNFLLKVPGSFPSIEVDKY